MIAIYIIIVMERGCYFSSASVHKVFTIIALVRYYLLSYKCFETSVMSYKFPFSFPRS